MQPSRRSALVAFSIVGALSLATAAHAQDWWSRGKAALEGFSGGSSGSVDVSAGLKEALVVGTGSVVTQLGREDGFYDDPAVHIPLPGGLEQVRSALRVAGMGAMLDDLELRLNRAAEVATPKAKALFLGAIREMTLTDARAIYEGPNDAATRYFQRKMSKPLAAEMTPIVSESLADVGAVRAYDDALGEYRQLPFVPDASADLTSFVVRKGMDGIFHYLAVEEAKIRTDPAARTTELLREVFGR